MIGWIFSKLSHFMKRPDFTREFVHCRYVERMEAKGLTHICPGKDCDISPGEGWGWGCFELSLAFALLHLMWLQRS